MHWHTVHAKVLGTHSFFQIFSNGFTLVRVIVDTAPTMGTLDGTPIHLRASYTPCTHTHYHFSIASPHASMVFGSRDKTNVNMGRTYKLHTDNFTGKSLYAINQSYTLKNRPLFRQNMEANLLSFLPAETEGSVTLKISRKILAGSPRCLEKHFILHKTDRADLVYYCLLLFIVNVLYM